MTAEPTPAATNPVADAYPPPEIAARVCHVGLAKVTTPVPTMMALAVLAGAFISLGALFYTVTITSGNSVPALPFGLLRVAGGCLLYTSPSPRDRTRSRMPSSA